jgi:molybdopterin synthase catalytic subunit
METHIEFTTQPIRVPAPYAALRETGAEVEFRGIVRETEQGRAIPGLNYEAHQAMARRQLERIINQLRETWPCQAVWFIHRLGWVPAGEASLYIRVQASHREQAFRFCMGLVDLLKKDVPIWKLTLPRDAGAASLSESK